MRLNEVCTVLESNNILDILTGASLLADSENVDSDQ